MMLLVLLLAIGPLSLPACVTEEPAQGLSKNLQVQLDELLRRVQYTQGLANLGDLRKLSAFGPYATEPVKEQLLSSDKPQLRANAVFVLGEIYRLDGDRAALAAVRSATADSHRMVRLEAARALLEAGEYDGIDELLGALEDPDRGTRVNAFLALRSAAGGLDYGYSPDGDPESRRLAVERFRVHFAQPPATTMEER